MLKTRLAEDHEEIAVGDVAVLVDVVDFESNCARVVVAAWRGGVRV